MVVIGRGVLLVPMLLCLDLVAVVNRWLRAHELCF